MDIDRTAAEHALMLAHGDLSANLQDYVVLSEMILRIQTTWRAASEQTEVLERVLARVVLRENRAREYVARELQAITQTAR